MAYTPELSQIGSATLRRLAWYRGKPMTNTLEALLQATGMTMAEIKPGEVCSKCRDKSICDYCPFSLPAELPRDRRSDLPVDRRAASFPTESHAISIHPDNL